MRRVFSLFCLLILATASPAKAGELKVMTLGDSIVAGVAGNFRTPLKHLLASDGFNITYVGMPRDADGNRHEVRNIVKYTTYTADVYVVYAGLNGLSDSSVAQGPEGYGPHAAAMKSILDEIFAHAPAARVVLAQIGHTLHNPTGNARISTFNRQLARMASAYAHADSLWLADLENVFANDPSNFVDGVHPNQKGCDLMAAALRPSVRAAAAAATASTRAVQWLSWGLAGLSALAGFVLLRRRRKP